MKSKRALILDAACHAIAEHGFHGMSMRDLARRTGMANAAFYNYFASKEEVLFTLQKEAFETLIARATVALEGAPDKLFAFIHQHVQYVADHPHVWRVLIHEAGALPPAERAIVRRLKERYYDQLRAVLGASEVATYGVFGMLNWTYGWYEPSLHGSPAEVARELHALVRHGLAVAAEGAHA